MFLVVLGLDLICVFFLLIVVCSVVSNGAINYLERHISKMTFYVSSGMLTLAN